MRCDVDADRWSIERFHHSERLLCAIIARDRKVWLLTDREKAAIGGGRMSIPPGDDLGVGTLLL